MEMYFSTGAISGYSYESGVPQERVYGHVEVPATPWPGTTLRLAEAEYSAESPPGSVEPSCIMRVTITVCIIRRMQHLGSPCAVPLPLGLLRQD